MKWAIGIIVAVILAGIFGPQFLFSVDETQYVVITRFGEIRRVKTEPGLNAKVPFIDTVTKLDKRLLRIDVRRASMPDRENQFLEIDAYVRYRILEGGVRRFRESLVDEVRASTRIGNLVIDELRAEIGRSNRSDIIGGEIIELEAGTTLQETVTIFTGDETITLEAGTVLENDIKFVRPKEDAAGVAAREAITRRVRDKVDDRVKSPENDFGVEVVDVRIKRADFPEEIREDVFARMRTERDVQAQRLRAEGEEEFLTRTADVNRRVEIISAEADKTSNTLRGEGEGEAIRILAEALDQDPEFFAFRRSLEAYKTFLVGQSTVVLSADSPLFQYLQSPAVPQATPAP